MFIQGVPGFVALFDGYIRLLLGHANQLRITLGPERVQPERYRLLPYEGIEVFLGEALLLFALHRFGLYRTQGDYESAALQTAPAWRSRRAEFRVPIEGLLARLAPWLMRLSLEEPQPEILRALAVRVA